MKIAKQSSLIGKNLKGVAQEPAQVEKAQKADVPNKATQVALKSTFGDQDSSISQNDFPLAKSAGGFSGGVLGARSASIQKTPIAKMDDLDFSAATPVVTSQNRATAMRFSIPIPKLQGNPLVYPKTYPNDMIDKDSKKHELAGKAYPDAGKDLADWQGNAVVAADGGKPEGLMFFNYEDNKFQGVQTDGDKILLINRFDEARGAKFEGKLAELGGPENLTLDTLQEFLSFANGVTPKGEGSSGLDVYDSDRGYAKKKLTALEDVSTGQNAYGMHMRTNEEIQAVFVKGPARVGNAPVDKEGAVFVLVGTDKESGERNIRHITPAAFQEGHLNPDGSAVDIGSLPVQSFE